MNSNVINRLACVCECNCSTKKTFYSASSNRTQINVKSKTLSKVHGPFIFLACDHSHTHRVATGGSCNSSSCWSNSHYCAHMCECYSERQSKWQLEESVFGLNIPKNSRKWQHIYILVACNDCNTKSEWRRIRNILWLQATALSTYNYNNSLFAVFATEHTKYKTIRFQLANENNTIDSSLFNFHFSHWDTFTRSRCVCAHFSAQVFSSFSIVEFPNYILSDSLFLLPIRQPDWCQQYLFQMLCSSSLSVSEFSLIVRTTPTQNQRISISMMRQHLTKLSQIDCECWIIYSVPTFLSWATHAFYSWKRISAKKWKKEVK